MTDIKEVQNFWNQNPCGSYLSNKTKGLGYFSEIQDKRYKLEWHIPIAAKFDEFKNKKILEIGCGVGIDGAEFAKNSAIYYGIDLTESAVNLNKEYFNLQNLNGYFIVANAENLPFNNNEFDHVYSWGVIHHSPDTEKIISEIYRVLKPGGTFCIMVYNHTSINYYIEIMFLRKLFRLFLKSKKFTDFLVKLGFEKEKLYRHRDKYLENSKITKEQWISMNTDGPDCPLAKVYNKKEVLKLF
ncbi:MAG: methyltransferase domain-containing protein, partial [Actinobacteria bacterium]|nr:methyltransferase domain-containing protein [Actinomycetota bacterium]